MSTEEVDKRNFWKNMDASDYEDPWIISGKGTTRDMWVELTWDGIDPDSPFTLPDGTHYATLLEEGKLDVLAETIWLLAERRGRTEDLEWTTGLYFAAVSTRFLEALEKFDAEGIKSCPMEIRSKRGEQLSGDYHLIVIDPGPKNSSPVRPFPLSMKATSSFDVTSEVFDYLKEQGITGFSAEHGLDTIKRRRENEEAEREWERKKATGDLTDYERELLEEERQLIAEAEAYDRENPR